MKVLLIGPPGAGKGTQAHKLGKEFDLPHLSAGQLLREAIEAETEAGKRARPYIDNGQLVPEEIVVKIMSREMFDRPGRDGFIADGFPRNIDQYEQLNRELDKRDEKIDVAIQLDLDEEDIVERLSGRMTCSECGRNYHVEFYPPETEGVCDACGGSLYERNDDNLKTIKQRLNVYRNESVPVIKELEKDGILERVDASGRIDEVFEKACEVIESRFHARAGNHD